MNKVITKNGGIWGKSRKKTELDVDWHSSCQLPWKMMKITNRTGFSTNPSLKWSFGITVNYLWNGHSYLPTWTHSSVGVSSLNICSYSHFVALLKFPQPSSTAFFSSLPHLTRLWLIPKVPFVCVYMAT